MGHLGREVRAKELIGGMNERENLKNKRYAQSGK